VAGTSADCDQATKYTATKLSKQRILTNAIDENMDSMASAIKILAGLSLSATPSGRLPHAVFVVGGIDCKGPSLYTVSWCPPVVVLIELIQFGLRLIAAAVLNNLVLLHWAVGLWMLSLY
jgi:hypothetical protein